MGETCTFWVQACAARMRVIYCIKYRVCSANGVAMFQGRMALREVGMAGRIRVRHADAWHADANHHKREVGRTARHLAY